jgi:hypothetical protein
MTHPPKPLNPQWNACPVCGWTKCGECERKRKLITNAVRYVQANALTDPTTTNGVESVSPAY